MVKSRTFLLLLLVVGLTSLTTINKSSSLDKDCDNPIKLKFEADTLYFDEVIAGTKVNLTYNFEVISCKPLRIHQVYTGCSCTSPSYSDSMLSPGSKGEINIEFDSKDWGADTGRIVAKRIYLMYTGGSQEIIFTGTVKSK